VDGAGREIRIETDPERLRPSDVPEFRGNPARAAADLGWEARIPLARSLADVLDEWRRIVRDPGSRRSTSGGPSD
jgi:GDP-D-mannose dehydratase